MPEDVPFGWRTSKACQECRKRKIKCNGHEPCKTCDERRTPCTYRGYVRQRKRRHQASQDTELKSSKKTPSASYTVNNSVSATDMTSQSHRTQLYYGGSSHFALLHEIYRDLVSPKTLVSSQARSEEPHEVEEAGAGLDMFSFRRIFFGTPVEPYEPTRTLNSSDMPGMFLADDLAKLFLQRFLDTLYYLVPFQTKEAFERQLDYLYSPRPGFRSDTWDHSMILLALAMGSLGTEHYQWGDILFDRVKASCALLDDVVNLKTHAHYQIDQGRPNSSFIHLGTAARKAISAGLHKEAPKLSAGEADSAEERRATFWSLFWFESWICFHLGRPRSLSAKDVSIAPPQDPFLLVLSRLSQVTSRSADEMYGQHHDSLLQMWRLARSITDDLRCYDALMKRALGFGVDKCAQPGSLGVRQAMLINLYHHTILLTYRPFLIFRGRWQQEQKMARQPGGKPMKRPAEVPNWLNEACNRALSAACKTIHYLCDAAVVNDLVSELRYHGYFLGSSSFALIYDLLHGEELAATHLPWIHAALQYLCAMRPGDPIQPCIHAIQTVMKQPRLSDLWGQQVANGYGHEQASDAVQSIDSSNHQDNPGPAIFPPELSLGAQLPMLPELQEFSPLQGDSHPASASVGSGEDLLDFKQSDMGLDFDFSTMDLEAFFSIIPAMEPPPHAF